MLKVTIKVDCPLKEAQAIKEILAMRLETFGRVLVTSIEVDRSEGPSKPRYEQIKMGL